LRIEKTGPAIRCGRRSAAIDADKEIAARAGKRRAASGEHTRD